jgi:tRNA-specific 2-thiouridylase
LLAVKIILEQGIEVLGVTFETPFFSARKAKISAERIGIPLLTLNITEEHMDMLRAPRYGYGKNMNPCIDCHTLMLKKSGRIMEENEADFVFTGEVLGQRPMSQNRQSLHTVAKNSGYGEYILRPLSAKFLPETKPEMEGKVDRERLLDIQGRGRKRQLALAEHYNIKDYTSPAGGCLLTDPLFSKRLKDLFDRQTDFTIRDVELLKVGRHFRTAASCKVIVGRNSFDNETLLRLSDDGDTVIHMAHYPGPTVLVPGGCDDANTRLAASICALYSDAPNDREVMTVCRTGNLVTSVVTKAAQRHDVEPWMI